MEFVVTLDQKERREKMDLTVLLVYRVLVANLVILEIVDYLVLEEMLVHLEVSGFPGNRDQLESRDRRESQDRRCVTSIDLCMSVFMVAINSTKCIHIITLQFVAFHTLIYI